MGDWLRRFMQGRYGSDTLSRAMLAFSLLLVILSALFSGVWLVSMILDAAGLAGIIITYYRMLSRDISRRSSENQKFLKFTRNIQRRFSREKYMMDQRKTNHIYSCPNCGQKIRVPKGKGKIEIDCPKCHNKFIKKS